MTHKQKMALATLRGRTDGQVTLAKACVRAACIGRDSGGNDYARGYHDGNLHKAVDHLRSVRDIQRTLVSFCKEVGYA